MRIFGYFLASVGVFAASTASAAIAAPSALLKDMPDPSSAPLSSNAHRRTAQYFDSVEKSAQSALRAGLPSLAQSILEDSLADGALPQNLRSEFRMLYIDSLIAQGNFETAQKQFVLLGKEADSVSNKIRRALTAIGIGNPNVAGEFLSGIAEGDVPKDDLPWYYLCEGYIEFENGNLDEAIRRFDSAKQFAVSRYALADIEIAVNVCKLSPKFDSENIEDLRNSLAGNVRLYFGTPQGFQFAKQYAAVLFRLGRTEEALDVINSQLDIELAQEIDKDELRVISAVMIKDPRKQLNILRDILRQTQSVGVAELALALLAKNTEISNAELAKFIDTLLNSGSERIRDRLLLEAANTAIKSKNGAAAAKYAGRIVEEFPASRYKAEALRILAWAAFATVAGKEPEFRLAATYLSSLADLEKEPEKADEMRMLSADCYFLNKDYANAAKIYESLLSNSPKRGTVLNKGIESYLKQGDDASAIKLADSARAAGSVADDDIWNAEWKIISKFRSDGKNKEALDRIESFVKSTSSKPLLIKMEWLKARLTEESGDVEKTISQCDKILKDIKTSGITDGETRNIVGSNTMLMKARSLESAGRLDGKNGAFEAYKQLRETYPASDAAKVSHLYQARAEAARGNFAAAQQFCRTLVDADPSGAYAYDAITDAAQYARQMGLEADYKAALSMLDKLCKDFPDNPRNFYARLSQAEILRLINAFADARKLYEEIINKYPAHPEIHLAWLGLGDSALAQPARTLDAVAIFERLYALPDMPVSARAEAAFKCGYALERAGRTREANEMLWLTSEQLLQLRDLTPSARYWIGRSLYNLAASLEASGQKRDARAAYELIAKYKLPSAQIARQKLGNASRK